IAAVIGKDVPFSIVQAVAGVPEDALRAAFAHLKSAEFLHETSVSPDTEYTFKHALTHEAAYASMPPEQRSALHARIVEAIERRPPLLPLGELEPLLPHPPEPARLALHLGHPLPLGRSCLYMPGQPYLTGDHPRALEYGRRTRANTVGRRDFCRELGTNACRG